MKNTFLRFGKIWFRLKIKFTLCSVSSSKLVSLPDFRCWPISWQRRTGALSQTTVGLLSLDKTGIAVACALAGGSMDIPYLVHQVLVAFIKLNQDGAEPFFVSVKKTQERKRILRSCV